MGKSAHYDRLYKQLGYVFKNEGLLSQALTHRSANKLHNERLEFLGDAVLGMVIGDYLYSKFETVAEGSLTRMRSTIVKGQTLAKVGAELNLGDLVQLGSGEKKSGGRRRESILADAVEAILGAIYLDSNIATVQRVILSLFSSRLSELDPSAHPKDNKTRLQEYLQGRKRDLPTYTILSTEGKEHDQTFTVSCSVDNGEFITQGTASSRRYAEQNAAGIMLEVLSNG